MRHYFIYKSLKISMLIYLVIILVDAYFRSKSWFPPSLVSNSCLPQVYALCSTEKVQAHGYKPLCRPGMWYMHSAALRRFRPLATSPPYGPGT